MCKKREGDGPTRKSSKIPPRHLTPMGDSKAEQKRQHRRAEEVKRRDAKRRKGR